MKITSKTKLCMLIGDPIEHSLSPQMHNSGFEALGIDDQFVFLVSQVKVTDLKDFTSGVRVMKHMRGFTCTVPHKVEIMQYLDQIDPIAKKIGAVNAILNEDGILKGSNTDWIGFVKPLEKLTSLPGKKIALLGTGGVARSIAYAVSTNGGRLKVYNRTEEKAKVFAEEFGGEARSFDSLEEVKDADIIVNATPIGMREEKTPVPKDYISDKQIVFDSNYPRTLLLRNAEEKGAKIIDGREMLLYLGMGLFTLFTGYDGPEEAMRKGLGI
jgi:shikimate dehydrogenase